MSKLNDCPICGDGVSPAECGHTPCQDCGQFPHECAWCCIEYCDCTEDTWAEGANGIVYCSQDCADEADCQGENFTEEEE